MNDIEKRVLIPVLILAFSLFFLGFTATGFILAIGVAMFLGSTTGRKVGRSAKAFPLPPGNWSPVHKAHSVPVTYSSLASDHVMRFMAGYRHDIELKHEAMQHAGGAMTVYGSWTDASGCRQRHKLGHVTKSHMAAILREIDRRPGCLVSARVSKLFSPAQHKVFGGLALDIAVLEPCPKVRPAARDHYLLSGAASTMRKPMMVNRLVGVK